MEGKPNGTTNGCGRSICKEFNGAHGSLCMVLGVAGREKGVQESVREGDDNVLTMSCMHC